MAGFKPAVILVRPRVSDNLGAVARLMMNFGLSDLRLVEPIIQDLPRIRAVAAGGTGVWNETRTFPTLPEAVADLQWTIGVTARKGKRRMAFLYPPDLADHLTDLPTRKVGFIFGPEDAGLSDADLAFCREILTIPANPAYSSLNLSHAVALVLYEARKAAYGFNPPNIPPPADLKEIAGMERHIEKTLLTVGFLDPRNPSLMMGQIRRFLARVKLTKKDVKIIRGICRRINLALEGKKRWSGRGL